MQTVGSSNWKRETNGYSRRSEETEVNDEEGEVVKEGNVVKVDAVVDRSKENRHKWDRGKYGARCNLKMQNTYDLMRYDVDLVISDGLPENNRERYGFGHRSRGRETDDAERDIDLLVYILHCSAMVPTVVLLSIEVGGYCAVGGNSGLSVCVFKKWWKNFERV